MLAEHVTGLVLPLEFSGMVNLGQPTRFPVAQGSAKIGQANGKAVATFASCPVATGPNLGSDFVNWGSTLGRFGQFHGFVGHKIK